VDQISVPNETSGVFHIGLNNLVQVTSNVPHLNNLQAQPVRPKSRPKRQSSAKGQPTKKVTEIKDKANPTANLKA